MRNYTVWATFLSLGALASGACSDSSSGQSDTTVSEETTADVQVETVDFDTAPPDTGAPEEVIASTSDFGEACNGNTDCESGWCVEGPTGYVCTEQCLEECPSGYDCKSVQLAQGDVTFLCLPRVQKLCVPCLEDFQCNLGACLTYADGDFCASPCESGDECPSGYNCAPDSSGEHEGSFCQPNSGACDCSPPFEGVTRTCTLQNDIGTCIGIETCDPEVGWVGCTAREASDELCDYLDNNCDGTVDEGFTTDGVYASQTGCGSCTTSCDTVLPNAAETECFVSEGLARCRVVSCKPGYTMLNQFVCVPDVGNICTECQADAECLGDGAACTTLNDGSFCTGPCLTSVDCPVGFVCEDTGAQDNQCVPASGSCTCDGTNTDLARACEITFTPNDPGAPVTICKGFEQCTTDGWGDCDLPDDACDGIDNDCDGVIDGPHKTGDKYTALEHCGSCEISCLGFVRDNAEPLCDASESVPVCTYRCTGDAVDVNGRSDDGCECLPQAGPDLAGDDVDSNCDGVDGEVDNAIFVSKDGNDQNPGTIELPVLTIQTGLSKAAAANKRDVYVATGVYSQNLVLVNGVGLFGGYSPDFFQHDVLLFETAIIGEAPTASNLGTITATNVGAAGASRDTVLDGFTIFGINAGNIEGGNSYGVYVRNSGAKLRITHNLVFGGPGGNGKNGSRGQDGANGIDGTNGADAKNLSHNCGNADRSGGGQGGVRSCDGNPINGGDGGRANCPDYEDSPGNSANGGDGNGDEPGEGGTYGWPLYLCANDNGCSDIFEYGLGCGLCWVPTSSKPSNASNGTDGVTGTNGSRGTAGSAGGSASSGQWVGNRGGDGGTGTNGSGGGGGGAGGGVEVVGNDCSNTGNDDVGGSGGGGGSGGCLGTGGTGGLAGGGSFAIFVVGSNPDHAPEISDNSLMGGRGGAGGNGGAGGVGGEAGEGGSGGVAGDALSTSALREVTRCARAGGDGGNGGSGGHGGGGGGGAGGPSYALYVSLPATPPGSWKSDNDFLAGGEGGQGGAGGVSVDQASSGLAGGNGAFGNTNF